MLAKFRQAGQLAQSDLHNDRQDAVALYDQLAARYQPRTRRCRTLPPCVPHSILLDTASYDDIASAA